MTPGTTSQIPHQSQLLGAFCFVDERDSFSDRFFSESDIESFATTCKYLAMLGILIFNYLL